MLLADRVTGIWPQTEALLAASSTSDYANQKDQAILDTIARLYATYAPGVAVPSIADIEAGSDLVEQQVADLAVLQLLSIARDYYMQDVLRQGAEGGDVTLYDKLKAVSDLATELRDRTAERAALVAAAIRAPLTPITVAIPGLFTVASGRRGL